MELREAISEGFDYDLWANRKWVLALGGFNDNMLAAQEALEHILNAQRIWLERCGVQVFEPQENVELDKLFELYAMAWQAQVDDRPLDETIQYVNLAGEQHRGTLNQIARHVINHGTYHRGHLRGLAAADSFSTFPDTDLIHFLRERESK